MFIFEMYYLVPIVEEVFGSFTQAKVAILLYKIVHYHPEACSEIAAYVYKYC